MLAMDQENRKAIPRNSRVNEKKTYPRLAKPRKPCTALTVQSATALQICKADGKKSRVPYAINWRNITRTTNAVITRTPMGPASYAMSQRAVTSEPEDTSMQKVGVREDKEKKTYEPNTSRERRYERRYQHEEVGLLRYAQ